MLPDPDDLRGAAAALTSGAEEVAGRSAAVDAAARGTVLSGPLVDDLRRQLAIAAAAAATGVLALLAAAAHLRALAVAVEELLALTRSRRTAAADLLLDEIAAAPTPEQAAAARARLAGLPPAPDPRWARDAVPVVLPFPVEVPAAPVPSGRPGVVEADLPAVRALAATLRSASGVVAERAGIVAARSLALGLPALDPYGLAGSRSAAYLADVSGPRSALAAAADGWQRAATACALLADRLTAADSGSPVGPVAPWWSPGPLDAVDGLRGLWQLPREVVDELDDEVAAAAARFRQLRRDARSAPTALRASLQAEAADVMRAARNLRAAGRGVQRIAGHLRVPEWLVRQARPIADLPGLRSVSRLGGVFAVGGVVLDVAEGTGLPMALAKGVAGLAAATLAGAAAAALLVTAPAWLSALGVLTAGAAAAVVATGAVARYGPALWAQVRRLDRTVSGWERSAVRGIRRVTSGLGRGAGWLGRRLPGLPGLPGRGSRGWLGRVFGQEVRGPSTTAAAGRSGPAAGVGWAGGGGRPAPGSSSAALAPRGSRAAGRAGVPGHARRRRTAGRRRS